MRLRILDFGTVSPLRSQAVYHGLAEAMGVHDDPILVLVRPAAPYLCLGAHQSLDEVDQQWCARHGLAVIRRQVGGGAVLLDSDQIFFHFIYPRRSLPGPVQAIYPRFIEPVVRTYRALGLPARLAPPNDIQVRERKIGGTGAAHIGQAAVMVGSFLLDFDFATMSRVMRLPSPGLRPAFRRAMAAWMTTLRREMVCPPPVETLKDIFLKEVAETLAMTPVFDLPQAEEQAAIRMAEAELTDPEWMTWEGRRQIPHGIKIAAHTYLTERHHAFSCGVVRIRLLTRKGRIEWLSFPGRQHWRVLAKAVRGCELDVGPLSARLHSHLQKRDPSPEELAGAILETAHRP